MKLAFLIQAHKSENQIEKLINYLISNECDVYLHIDLKSDNLYNNLLEKFKKRENVFFIKKRYNVNWSGLSQIKASLKLFEEASNKKYDFYFLMSGQDLVIKEISLLKEYLKKNLDKNFLTFNKVEKERWRLKRYSFFTENKNNRKLYIRILDNLIRRVQFFLPERKNLKNLTLYKGSQWLTLSNNAVEYILDETYKKNYMTEFKYTACADEHYFQTILLNSKYKDMCVNDNLYYIIWKFGKNSPEVMKMDKFMILQDCGCFFSRKFDEEVDNDIIDKIYEKIQR